MRLVELDSSRREVDILRTGEQATIRARAAAAGKTGSRFVLDLALADDPERHPVALTVAEQTELHDRGREVWIFVCAVKQAVGDSGLSLPEAIRGLRSPSVAPSGGGRASSSPPSLRRKLFIDAQASTSVPSTEKCSSDNSRRTRSPCSTARRKRAATSPATRRSRLFEFAHGLRPAPPLARPVACPSRTDTL